MKRVDMKFGRLVIPALFGIAAAFTAPTAFADLRDAFNAPSTQAWALTAHAALKLAALALFAFLTIARPAARQRTRDPLAFAACALALVGFGLLREPTKAAGASLVVAGDVITVVFGLWLVTAAATLGRCFGVLPEARGLVTHGLYSVVRHPLYLGEIGVGAGLLLAAPSAWNIVCGTAFVLGQAWRMRLEERALTLEFPEYRAYANSTPRFIPRPFVVARRSGLLSALLLLFLLVPAGQASTARPAGLHSQLLGGAPSLPYLAWSPVRGADHYQVQVAADPGFKSPVISTAFGDFTTANTRATLVKTLPSHRYWWRVRAATKAGAVSGWSSASFAVSWNTAPQRDTSGGSNVLRWRAVPGAGSYLFELSQDASFATVVGGRGIPTNGTSVAVPTTLPKNTYYWRVTPLDAEGNAGRVSQAWKLDWSGPSSATSVVAANALTPGDLSAFPGAAPNSLFLPRLSWKGAAGAARYELEINPDKNWAIGSRVCCNGTTSTTSLTPNISLLSNRYYWRVRSLDSAGNAGAWFPNGPGTDTNSFTKTFDNQCSASLPENCIPVGTATIPDLRLEDANGSRMSTGASTTSPVIRWNAVPGASSYDYEVTRYDSAAGGCQWGAAGGSSEHWAGQTATTAWTALGPFGAPPFPARNVTVAFDPLSGQLVPGHAYCARVRARTDRDPHNADVVGDYTYLPSVTAPAFTFSAYPAGGGSAYLSPPAQASLGQMPLFTWQPVAGALSYWVIVAKDASFTNLIDYALTRIPAYAPRGTTLPTTYPDETTAYYWVVIPSPRANGACAGACGDPLSFAHGSFQKAVPPTNLRVTGDRTPTFDWHAVAGARRYQLQVSTDPNFGASLVDDVTTVATSYTALQTYPSQKQLYWRVRAYDEKLVGLSWSSAGAPFRVTLPVPHGLRSEASGSGNIPTWRWDPVPGAASYDLHASLPDGSQRDFSHLSVPAFTATTMTGLGIYRWRVRANFSTAFGAAAGPYSTQATYRRDIWQPTATRTIGSGQGIVLAWRAVLFAKSYRVQISNRRDFSQTVEIAATDNTSYAPLLGPSFQKGGIFYWRVAATDKAYNTGQFTQPSMLRIRQR
jgi:protein-S-isoprenylcysteine O-methyltransferase Ste14